MHLACLLSRSPRCSRQTTLPLGTLPPRLAWFSRETCTTSFSLWPVETTFTRWPCCSFGAWGTWVASKPRRTLWALHQGICKYFSSIVNIDMEKSYPFSRLSWRSSWTWPTNWTLHTDVKHVKAVYSSSQNILACVPSSPSFPSAPGGPGSPY